MVRALFLLLCTMLFSPMEALSQDLGIPVEVRPAGQYVSIQPKGEAKKISYVGLSGVDAVPSMLLRDSRMFLLDTRGLASGRYRFAAIGSSGDEDHVRQDFVVVVGDSPTPTPVPPVPVPPTPTPTPPAPVPALDEVGKLSYQLAMELPPPAKQNFPLVVAAYDDVVKKAETLTQGYSSINEIQAKMKEARTTAQGDTAAWGAWDVGMGVAWTALWQSTSGRPTRDQVLKFHKSTRNGLQAASGK